MVYAELLAEFSRRERLPVMHSFSEGVKAGGLISYGPHYPGFGGDRVCCENPKGTKTR